MEINNDGLNIPVYASGLFLQRKKELDLVTSAVNELYVGDDERKRTLLFRGERGSGKSWLALQMHRKILKVEESAQHCQSLLFFLDKLHSDFEVEQEDEWELRLNDSDANLEVLAVENSARHEKKLAACLYWIAQRIDAQTVLAHPKPNLDELSEWLCRDIATNFTKKVLVLIFDSVFEADQTFVELLEMHLLGRLVHCPKVLLVMTGRGRSPAWPHTPRLRVDVEEHWLEPFDVQTTQEQLMQQLKQLGMQDVESRAAEVHRFSMGYPLANLLFAYSLHNPADALRAYFAELVDKDEPDEIQKWCSCLCILDSFREDIADKLLKQDEIYTSFRDIRSKIGTKYGWLRWEGGRFIWDKAIVHPTREVLLRTDPARWKTLNCAAWQYYLDKTNEDPEGECIYKEKAAPFLDNLKRIHINVDQCNEPELPSHEFVAEGGD